jgi:hypothetical protein
MNSTDYTLLAVIGFLIFLILIGAVLLLRYLSPRILTSSKDLREQQDHDYYRQRDLVSELHSDQEQTMQAFEKRMIDTLSQRLGSDNTWQLNRDGFVVSGLSNDEKKIFRDLLLGFEDYAELKGYGVDFNLDSVIPGQIAFVFTVTYNPNNVSAKEVIDDLKEYLSQASKRILSVPSIKTENEIKIAEAITGRWSNLDNYSGASEATAKLQRKVEPVQPNKLVINLLNGGDMSQHEYIANNSRNVAQGNGNRITDGSTNITIARSFNERGQQLEDIENLIKLLVELPDATSDSCSMAVRELENVKEELQEQGEPDAGRVSGWMRKAATALEYLNLGEKGIELARIVFSSFNLGHLISRLH